MLIFPSVILLLFVSVYLSIRYGGEKGRYIHDHNPGQRTCADCGQLQMAYCGSMEDWDNDWWEANGKIKNPDCKCHKDTR